MSSRDGWLLLALIALVYLIGVASIVYGQEDAALLLARTCVSERGWAVETNDCAAIYEVAQRRAASRGVGLGRALMELSPRLHGRGPTRRGWIRGLRPDGSRPPGWPRVARWPSRRSEWLQTYSEASELVGGLRSPVCASQPVSWGSAQDLRRGRARGRVWVGVDCGETRNAFGSWR